MALGEILSVVDTQGFACYKSTPLGLCKRNKNIVVCITQNLLNNYCLARSIAINDAGEINATPAGSLVVDESVARDLGLIHWLEDVFICISNDAAAKTFLFSFTVSNAGSMQLEKEDELQIGASSNLSLASDLLQPHAGVLLTGECGPVAPDHIESFIIPSSGTFPDAHADSLEFALSPKQIRLRHSSGTIIVGVWSRSSVINIFTFTCSAFGIMPAHPDHTWPSFTAAQNYFGFSKVTNTVYAIFTVDDDDKARIRTFSIESGGSINEEFLATKVVDDVDGPPAYITGIGGGYFIVAYTVKDGPFRLRTYHINYTGNTIGDVISTRDIAETSFSYPKILQLQANLWAMAFFSETDELMIYTLEIETPTEGVPHHEMLMGIGP